jgi:hypothetical protein
MQVVPAEHIIPKNIGGTVVTYQVCGTCNNLFSTFDSYLNRHRHIYDSYKNISSPKDLSIEFRFVDHFTNLPGGGCVKFVPKSSNLEVISSKIGDGKFICDCNSSEKNDIYLQKVSKVQKKYNISNEFITNHVKKYHKFKKESIPGSVFRDDFLISNFELKINENTSYVQNTMYAQIPHRFIAKACVEYSSLLGISQEIANIEDLKTHAKEGGLEGVKLQFFEDIASPKDGNPCHFIIFSAKQFVIAFLGKWGVAVNIEWQNEPKLFYLVNDLIRKKLFECSYKNNEMICKYEIEFSNHNATRRPTNIKR